MNVGCQVCCLKPAGDDPPADGRNLSIPTRSSAGCSRPLSMVQCLTDLLPKLNLGGGAHSGNATPLYYCTSAGHHVLGEKCVFIAGSFPKKSVFKAGTTVWIFKCRERTYPKYPKGNTAVQQPLLLNGVCRLQMCLRWRGRGRHQIAFVSCRLCSRRVVLCPPNTRQRSSVNETGRRLVL